MPSELPGRVAAKLLRHRAGTAAFCTLTYKLETLYKAMQILFRAFLAIYLAHLLTDFVFQTHRLVEQKRRGKLLAYFFHGLTHYLSAVILVSFRSEEHTSELQSRVDIVCRLLLEKKKQ